MSRPSIPRARADRRRYAILGMLTDRGPMAAEDITNELGYWPGTLYTHLVWLEHHGLVESYWMGERESRRRIYRAATTASSQTALP